MTRRELCAHGALFIIAYGGFLGHFRLEEAAIGNVAEVFAAPRFVGPVVTDEPPASNTVDRRVAAVAAPGANQKGSVQTRVGVATQTQDQPIYEPVPVQIDSQSQLAAFAAQMSDPDPEVARVARDAYMAVLEGR